MHPTKMVGSGQLEEIKVSHMQQYLWDPPEISKCRHLSCSLLHADQSVHLHSVEQVHLFVVSYFIKAANRQSEPANVRGWILAIIALLDWIWSQPICRPSKTSRAVVWVRWNLVSYLIVIYLGSPLSLTHTHSFSLFSSLSFARSRCHCASRHCLNGEARRNPFSPC